MESGDSVFQQSNEYQYPFDVTKRFPDCKGLFGEYGGFTPDPRDQEVFDSFTKEHLVVKDSPAFAQQLQQLQRHWLGRPTPMYHAQNLSEKLGGAQIYLKREDLTHTGAHKINHCLGQSLLAKMMGRKRIITDTASGTHGICLATAAARMGLECVVYVGENDWEPQLQSIHIMQALGAKVESVKTGQKNLKEAAERALREFLEDPMNVFLGWSTIAGPQPFPNLVRDFQAVVGDEAREQIKAMVETLPQHVVASVAGGSNALGIFQSFLSDQEVELYAVEPEMPNDGNSVNLGNPGAGYMESFTATRNVHSETVTPEDAAAAFIELSRMEGIMPAWESTFALAHAIRLAKKCNTDEVILVNLSGRGHVYEVEKSIELGAFKC